MMKFDPKGLWPSVNCMLRIVNARVWFDMRRMSGKPLKVVDAVAAAAASKKAKK